MPGGDGTGPMGCGPMTGRGAGYCAGNGMPGYANYGGGRGGWFRGPRIQSGGRGFSGRGRGWRNMFYATGLPGWMRYGGYYGQDAPYAPALSREDELRMLKDQAEYFKSALEDINKRLNEMESGGGQ